MAKATTSSGTKYEGPVMTPEQLTAKKAELDAEIDAEYGKDPSDKEKEEPAEKLDSKEPEQEQEKAEAEESDESQTPEAIEAEKPEPPEEAKEKRYKEQLEGERKSNAELQARLQALEAKITTQPQQQREFTEEEKQFLEEKKMLKEKYGLVEKQEVLELLDARLKPVQKKREQGILSNLYGKFPDVSPDKDPSNEKWDKVVTLLNRFTPSNPTDPLDDYEERFEWAHEKVYGKKTPNAAQARQTAYAGVGGGTSAAKSRTTVGNDKYANLSPAARARKEAFDASVEAEWAREDAKK